VTFQLEPAAAEGWQVFSVTFDPAQVSTQQVQTILQDAGARLIPPPQ
jgi:hypothetical protein